MKKISLLFFISAVFVSCKKDKDFSPEQSIISTPVYSSVDTGKSLIGIWNRSDLRNYFNLSDSSLRGVTDFGINGFQTTEFKTNGTFIEKDSMPAPWLGCNAGFRVDLFVGNWQFLNSKIFETNVIWIAREYQLNSNNEWIMLGQNSAPYNNFIYTISQFSQHNSMIDGEKYLKHAGCNDPYLMLVSNSHKLWR